MDLVLLHKEIINDIVYFSVSFLQFLFQERAERLKFEQKRKAHYNEFYAGIKIRQNYKKKCSFITYTV